MRRIVDSPIGPLFLRACDGVLTELMYAPTGPEESGTERDDAVLSLAAQELASYFSGTLKEFTVPLRPEGTVFRMAVWEQLRRIPYGETRTYGDIARALGRPAASRAVGMANHVNPIAIIIPCHRVIGVNGKLTGYAGGLDVKSALLQLEKHGQI